MTKIKFLILSLFLFQATADEGKLSDFLKPSNIGEYIVGEIATLDINFGFDLFDEDLTSGLNVSGEYDYQMQPSYIPNKYMRTDEWTLSTKVEPGALLGFESPIHFSINKNSKIYFIRNFDSQMKALKAMPYTVKHLPRSAKSVMENLKPGDFVSYPATLTVGGGISDKVSKEMFKVEGVLAYMLTGQFTINVFKQDERYVRLKLIANASRGASTSAEMDLDNLVGTTIVENIVEKIVFTDIFDAVASKKKGETYILDYLFDFENEQARKAFDEIIKPQFKLNLKDYIKKHIGIKFFEKKLLSDFSRAEKLHESKNGVKRVFKGFNRYRFRKAEIEGSLLVAKAGVGSVYYKNHISVFDKDGKKKNYFFPNKINYYKGKYHIRGLFKREDQFETSFYGLVPTDSEFAGQKYSDVGMSFWRHDDSLTRREWRYLKQKILNMWPEEIVSGLDFSVYDKAKRKREVQLESQILFKENAFEMFKTVKLQDIKDKFKEVLKNKIRVRNSKVGQASADMFKKTKGIFNFYYPSIKSVSRKLHNLLTNPELNAKERIEGIIDLKDRALFKRYGYRVLMELTPRESWSDVFYTKFRIVGIELPEIKFELGKLKHSKIFEEVLSINKELHDPSRDLRFILNDYETDLVTTRLN